MIKVKPVAIIFLMLSLLLPCLYQPCLSQQEKEAEQEAEQETEQETELLLQTLILTNGEKYVGQLLSADSEYLRFNVVVLFSSSFEIEVPLSYVHQLVLYPDDEHEILFTTLKRDFKGYMEKGYRKAVEKDDYGNEQEVFYKESMREHLLVDEYGIVVKVMYRNIFEKVFTKQAEFDIEQTLILNKPYHARVLCKDCMFVRSKRKENISDALKDSNVEKYVYAGEMEFMFEYNLKNRAWVCTESNVSFDESKRRSFREVKDLFVKKIQGAYRQGAYRLDIKTPPQKKQEEVRK